MTENADETRPPEFVQSLERGLAVIRAFSAEHPRLSLSDVARKTGLSRAATRRFLHTLVGLGYVGTDDREFFLRPQLLELGYAYLSGLSLPELAQPHLQRLSDETGESSSVGVIDGDDIVYVARVATYRIMSATIGIGTRLPAFVTSMGRAIIGCGPEEQREQFIEATTLIPLTSHTARTHDQLRAALVEAGAQGWAYVDQELEDGLRSIAAPIRDASGCVAAAVNVSAPVRRGSIDEIRETIVPQLLRAAADIEQDFQRTGGRIR